MAKVIEYGKRTPKSDFDRRPAVGSAEYAFGKRGKGSSGGNSAKQGKKVGMGDRQQS
jgi:hypothetical protein